MPNGHDYTKRYGSHKYDGGDGTGHCKCGAWMGDARSDAPIGVDPFGECPENPLDGGPTGTAGHEIVVKRRIMALVQRVHEAEKALKAEEGSSRLLDLIKPEALKIKVELDMANRIITELSEKLERVKRALE